MDYIRNMKSSTFETKTPHSQISHIGHVNLIHGSSHNKACRTYCKFRMAFDWVVCYIAVFSVVT